MCLPSNLARRMPARPRSMMRFALELGDRSDDDDDGPSERATRIDALAEADELDAEAVELVQHFQEVPDGPGDPVRGPHHHHLKAAAAGRVRHPSQRN